MVKHNAIKQKHLDKLSWLDKFGLLISKVASTMYFFVFCALLLVIGIAFPKTQTVVFFISSGVIQLLMLPVLSFASDMQSRYTDARSEHDLKVDMRNEKHMAEIKKLLREIKEETK